MSYTRALRNQGGFPKPGAEITDMPGRHNREGWTHVADHDSVYIDGKQYRHMREWKRPCAICQGAVSAFEKSGMVDANSRFSNRTCKDHRGLLPAVERGFIAWDTTKGQMVAGPSCGAGQIVAAGDVETLRTANATMREELTGLYARNRELFEELQKYKAKHDLGPAMAAESQNKMPWQGCP